MPELNSQLRIVKSIRKNDSPGETVAPFANPLETDLQQFLTRLQPLSESDQEWEIARWCEHLHVHFTTLIPEYLKLLAFKIDQFKSLELLPDDDFEDFLDDPELVALLNLVEPDAKLIEQLYSELVQIQFFQEAM